MSDQNNQPIASLTRAKLIELGALVDLMQFKEIHKFLPGPIACTSTVWDMMQQASETSGKTVPMLLVEIYKQAIAAYQAAGKKTSTVLFSYTFVGDEELLQLHYGLGDSGERVLTLMLASED